MIPRTFGGISSLCLSPFVTLYTKEGKEDQAGCIVQCGGRLHDGFGAFGG